ncbi:MAG: hypothetical protein HGA98_06435 [Deltaproteobacteria bacterium]|nr:hypothetical protein [Deltaproteobacteria bacterium]
MVGKRMENWEAGDFAQSFRKASAASSDPTFKRELGALADALGSLDTEFFRETSGCGNQLSAVLDEMGSIGGRMGYCQRDRGFESDCRELYGDVRRAVESVESLESACFL